MAYTYILQSLVQTKAYVGSTDNLERRLQEHNSGHSHYTSRFKPWKIVYSEEFTTLSEARKREKYFKSAAGRKLIKKLNIIRE